MGLDKLSIPITDEQYQTSTKKQKVKYIKIYVEDGCVIDVKGLPKGYGHVIIDSDNH